MDMFTRIKSVAHGYSRGELDEGVLVIQKDGGQNTFDLWVAVVTHKDLDAVTAAISVTRTGEPERSLTLPLARYHLDRGRTRGVPPGARFFHNHLTVPDLTTDARYEVEVDVEGCGRAGSVARTLPSRLSADRSLRLLVGSCYDFGTDPDDRVATAYGQLFPPPHAPDLTVLVGDQVYADAPITRYGWHAQRNPRADLLLRYWTTWGMSAPPPVTGWRRLLPELLKPAERTGLRSALSTGPNYFLPDDHEFWNNWPYQTLTARDSSPAAGETLVRWWRRWRARFGSGPPSPLPQPLPGAEPQAPPATAWERNHLPVHPAERSRWSLASFELFEAFQTRSRSDRLGEPTRGSADLRHVGPPDATAPGVHPPRNEILQTIRVAPMTLCLLDTRTRRTRCRNDERYSQFVDQHYLDALLEQARSAEILVLVTPQPLLHAAGWRPGDRGGRERTSLHGDINMWDYSHQWQKLWRELIAARDKRPTVTIGGDIHQSYIAFADDLNLVEVVSSPLSLVWGSGPMEMASRVFRRARTSYEPGARFAELREIVDGPGPAPNVRDTAAVSRGCLNANEEGLARLTFELTAPGAVTFTAELFRRDEVAGGATSPAVTGRYQLAVGTPSAGSRSVKDLLATPGT